MRRDNINRLVNKFGQILKNMIHIRFNLGENQKKIIQDQASDINLKKNYISEEIYKNMLAIPKLILLIFILFQKSI